jgi:hypothetical protein
MKAFRLAAAMCCAAALAACIGSRLYQPQLVVLDQGMSPDTTVTKLGLPPIAITKTEVDGVQFTMHRYIMDNGAQSFAPYFLIFESGKLKYWGYVDEFRRHPDRRLGRAIDVAWAEFLEERRRARAQ